MGRACVMLRGEQGLCDAERWAGLEGIYQDYFGSFP